jgi:acyl-CoA synthetase (AMP-forming)/AMP-acid ligase II
MLLHEPLDRMAATDPQRPALSFRGDTITFGQLSARTRRVAAALDHLTAPGDRVAIIGENHPSWVEAYYGVPRAGRILVFLNHRLAAAELASIVVRAGATVVVGPRAELDRIEQSHAAAHGSMPTYIDLDEWARMGNEGAREERAPERAPEQAPEQKGESSSPDTPIWLIYTSGTTGSPKGATLTHRNVAASLVASAHGRPIGPDDVFLHPFPLCHVAGYNVVRNLAAGRPVVLMDRFEPGEFISLIDRHQVTKTTMAATMLSSLLDHLDAHPEVRPALASLEGIAYGAAPMAPTLLRRAFDELRIDFSQGYGMTELAGNAVFLGIEEHRRALAGADHLLTAAGRPAPNVEVRVLDDDDHEVATGVPGEIVVRGDQVMAGYWGDVETTKAVLTQGWLHTGDIGVFDADGVLSVVDRKKDVIVTGAENVSSREVEEEILRVCPEVREVAVVAVPDPHWGENVCAVIVLRAGATLTPDALIGRVRERLAGFKAPRHVVEVDELPKNSLGKLLKHDLRGWLAEQPSVIGPRL